MRKILFYYIIKFMKKYVTADAKQTFELGKRLAQTLKGGEVIALDGDLGCGKTVFTKGLAQGLGISGNVSSPTYTIVKEYSGRLDLFHFDVYRIEDEDEMTEVGFDEYLKKGGVCIIEWARLIKDILPKNTIYIKMKKLSDSEREITAENTGEF